MKKLAVISILLLGILYPSFANTFSNEDLHYVITYKWGMIHKEAGTATLSLRNSGSNYSIMLSAKTKPWADKFYQVRDTLKGVVRISDLKPLSYTKIAHEKGKYSKDDIAYKYSGNSVTGKCKRFKRNEKGQISESSKELTAAGPVYDMLSVFYYLRHIDYANLTPGKEVKATVFSGSKSETIKIRNLGIEKVKMKNGTYKEGYHIKFNFTTDGKSKSSADMDTWISTTPAHIPLYLVGSLPVGQVRVYFVG